jgi:hypothetical protein
MGSYTLGEAGGCPRFEEEPAAELALAAGTLFLGELPSL